MSARAAVTAIAALLLAATPAHAAAPNDHNCAGAFASSSADGQTISGLARASEGVSEFVLPDANCGEHAA